MNNNYGIGELWDSVREVVNTKMRIKEMNEIYYKRYAKPLHVNWKMSLWDRIKLFFRQAWQGLCDMERSWGKFEW